MATGPARPGLAAVGQGQKLRRKSNKHKIMVTWLGNERLWKQPLLDVRKFLETDNVSFFVKNSSCKVKSVLHGTTNGQRF